MHVLDTDHLSEIVSGTGPGEALQIRLSHSQQQVACTIVSFEEILRGWLAEIHRQRKPRNQTRAYQRLFDVLAAFENWDVFPWDEPCVEVFEDLMTTRLGVKTMDLKIASIAMSRGATLLSRNLKDFSRIPGLVVEDWLS